MMSRLLLVLMGMWLGPVVGKSARIGMILPYTNVGVPLSGTTWKQVVCGAQMAVRHVNEKVEAIVPGLANATANLTLTGDTYDTGYSASPAIVSYRKLRADGGMALVGAARSAVSKPLAQLGEIDKMPQCSYWSSSPSLSDKQLYPYFGRTYPSDAITTKALPRLLSAYGWTHVGVLHVNDEYANNYARGMRDNSRDHGVTVVASVDYQTNTPSTYLPACRSLKEVGVNIIVVVAWDQDLPEILRQCKSIGLWGQGYAWISADAASPQTSLASGQDNFGLTAEVTAGLLDGMLNFFASPEASAGYKRLASYWTTSNDTGCENPFFNATDYPDIFVGDPWNVVAYTYDCVIAFAIAMARAVNPADGVEVAALFRDVTFDGASGPVQFDGNTSDREESSISYVLYNWVADGAAVHSYLASTISLRSPLERVPGYNISWPGPSKTQPLDWKTLDPCATNLVRDTSTGVPRCVPCPGDRVAALGTECIPKTAQLGLILPYTNGDTGNVLSGVTWKQVTCAGRLAVHHVNARFEGIVPGLGALVSNLTHLTGKIYDTGYSATPATISYRKMKAEGSTAMVAAARSAVSGPLATQGKIDQIPQCSYWSSSPSLSDELLYPYFGRTYPSDAITTQALPRVIASFGWRNIGVLHVNDDYANNYARGLRDNSKDYGVTVVASADYQTNTPETYLPACRSLKASGVNIIVVAAWDQDLPEILRVCKSIGLWGQGYAWISADAASAAASFSSGATWNQTPEQTAALLDGMLNFFASPEATAGYKRLASYWQTANDTECENPFFNASDHPGIFGVEPWNVAAYTYDCVIAFAIAMSRAVNPADGLEVAALFREVTFDGSSGDVRFDSRSDREPLSISYVLYNWVANGASVEARLAATVSLSGNLVAAPDHNITWHESTFTPIDRLTLDACPTGLVRDTSTGVPLCKLCPGDKVAVQEYDECIPKTAQLGLILPYTNGDTGNVLSGVTWKQVTCAGRLAVHHVNARFEGIVPGLGALVSNLTHLTGKIYDTGYAATPATISYRKMRAEGSTAMVAAARSAVSGPLATQGKIDQIPQCSYWSSSPSLSDELLYPYFGRTYPSDAITTQALPRVVASFGWRNIGVLHVNDDYANNYARGLRDNSKDYGVTVVASADYQTNTPETYLPACRSLKASGVNIIVVAAWDQDLPEILRVCKSIGLWGQGYAWISADSASAAASFSSGATWNQTPEQTAALLDGMLNFYASPEATAGYKRLASYWQTANDTECENPFFNASDNPGIFGVEPWNVAAYTYDCVIAFAIAMSRAVNPANGLEVAALFREVTFDGSSGDVRFDSRSDREPLSISYVLYNWVANGASVEARLAATVSLSGNLVAAPDHNIIWHESTFTPIDRLTLDACPTNLVRDTSTGVPLCVPCPGDRVASQGSECIPKTAQIGMIMPWTDEDSGTVLSGVSWKQMICAGRLAVHHVNSRFEGIVPGLGSLVSNLTHLTGKIYDTGYAATTASVSYRKMKAEGSTAMVAAARSAVSVPLATQGKIDQIPQCSYWSSSPSLSDQLQFPYFGRTYPSDAITTQALPRLLGNFSWRNVGVLYVNDDYGNAYNRGMRDNSHDYDVNVVVSASYLKTTTASFEPACRSLKNAGVNIIVVIAWDADFAGLLQACKDIGLWGQGYAWISADSASMEGAFEAAATQWGQTPAETAELFDGMLNFFASPEATTGYKRLASYWQTANDTECENPFFNASDHPGIFGGDPFNVAAYTYDCVIAFAIAMSRAVNPADGLEVAALFRETAFDGSSGDVRFDARSDREPLSISYVLYNWVANGASVEARLAATVSLSGEVLAVPGSNITWHESTFTPIDRLTLDACPTNLVRDTSTGVPLCVPCPGDRVASQGSECIPKTAQIGMIMPWTDEDSGTVLEGVTWKQMICAGRLAVRHVNSRFEGIVPGLGSLVSNLTHLTGKIYDTGYAATTATISYRKMRAEGSTAMVAAARSAVSVPLATQGKIDQIPQCSYWSSSPSLSDQLQFPYCARASCSNDVTMSSRGRNLLTPDRYDYAVGRTYPSDAITTQALPRLVSELGWRNVGVLHVNDDYGIAYNRGMRDNAKDYGVTVVASASYLKTTQASYEPACRSLKNAGVNIIVVIAWDVDFAGLLQACKDIGLWGPGYAWISADAASMGGAFESAATQWGQAPTETAELFNGMLNFFASPEATTGYKRMASLWPHFNSSDCENPFFNVTDYPDVFSGDPWNVGAYTYDCVIAFAIAMARAVNPADGAEVAALFREVEFDGASGDVRFDARADRDAESITYVLYNWVSTGSSVASNLAATISLSSPLALIPEYVIVWANNSQVKPVDVTTVELRCPPGQIREVGENLVPFCQTCPPGTYESARFTDRICDFAAPEFYAPFPGMVESMRLPCPANSQYHLNLDTDPPSVAAKEGATERWQCTCKEGFYNYSDTCIPCPQGAICYGEHYAPIARRGYGQLQLYSLVCNNPDCDGELTQRKFEFFECADYTECNTDENGRCSCPGGRYTTAEDGIKYDAYSCSDRFRNGSALCSKCDPGNATRLGVCQDCEEGSEVAFFILAMCFVIFWFPLLEHIVRHKIKSAYTSVSFIQFLGFYQEIEVGWESGIKDIFEGMSFFNLDLDTVFFSCAVKDWHTRWRLQLLLPLLYPCFCILHLLITYILSRLASEARFPTNLMMKSGWLPRTDFSRRALSLAYVPKGLFYLNLYYYMGASTSFVMFICEESHSGESFLKANPSTVCWEGEHANDVVLAGLGVAVYLVFIPLFYAYILLIYVPRVGQNNKWALAYFGFLYTRFLPDMWFWELAELTRKVAMIFITTWGQSLSPNRQCFWAMNAVMVMMIAELAAHPFQTGLHNVLEEYSSFVEFAVLLSGLVIRALIDEDLDTESPSGAGETTSIEWVNSIVYFLLVSSIAAVIFVALTDLRKERMELFAFKVRKKAQTMLSHRVFDIRVSNYLLLNWLAAASDASLENFARMERMLLRVVEGSEQSRLENALASRFLNMSHEEPYLLEWILCQPGSDGLYPEVSTIEGDLASTRKSAPKAEDESPTPRASRQKKMRRMTAELVRGTNEVVNTLALLTVADRGQDNTLPGIIVLNELSVGLILTWCADRAKAEEKELMQAVLNDLKRFEFHKRESMSTIKKIWTSIMNASQVVSVVEKDARLKRLFAKAKLAESFNGYTRTASGRLDFQGESTNSAKDQRSSSSRASGSISRIRVRSTCGENSMPMSRFFRASCSGPSVSSLREASFVKRSLLEMEDTPLHRKLSKLARQLAVQIPCEYVIVVPCERSPAPFVVEGAEPFSVNKKSKREKVARRHASREPTCPVGLCIRDSEVIEVTNMLLERRFDKTTRDTEKIFSTVCVPIFACTQVYEEIEQRSRRSSRASSAEPGGRKSIINFLHGNGDGVSRRASTRNSTRRRSSWAPINTLLQAEAESKAEIIAVLKVVNKIDFVRQMAGIPFNTDDIQIAGLYAEHMSKIINEMGLGLEASEMNHSPNITTHIRRTPERKSESPKPEASIGNRIRSSTPVNLVPSSSAIRACVPSLRYSRASPARNTSPMSELTDPDLRL